MAAHLHAATAPAEAAHAHPNRRHHTLYITEPGLYLHVREGQIRVRRGEEEVRTVPLRKVDCVLLLAHAAMSSGFLDALVTHDIPLQVFVGRGKAYGSLVAGGLPNPLRLRAQYQLGTCHARRLPLAADIVRAKLHAMLRRLRPLRGAGGERQRIHALLAAVDAAPALDTLRGIEGQATRLYFDALARRIRNPAFAFTVRSRKPPVDPINSLLSFAYSLLFAETMTALLAAGLDPHPGLLHELRPGHPALASDLMEPYRVLVADTFVITLVNTRRVTEHLFHAASNGGVYLEDAARRDVLEAYEAFMSRPLGGARGSVTPRQLLDAAAQAYLAVVLGQDKHLRLPLGADPDTGAEPDTGFDTAALHAEDAPYQEPFLEEQGEDPDHRAWP